MENLNEAIEIPGTNLKIQIVGNEGNEPHVHIKKGAQLLCRIKLFYPEYTEINNYIVRLSKDECKKLNEFIQTGTNWIDLVDAWYDSNPHAIERETPPNPPSYLKITDEIKGKPNSHRKLNEEQRMDELNILIDKINKDIEDMRNKK